MPGYSTLPGFVNRNNQEVIRKTDIPGNHYNQTVYELKCGHCEHRYGSNGADNWQRKCPNCQNGKPGLPFA